MNISILTIVDNGGDAEITGLEMDMALLVNDNLISTGASFNDTELVYVDPAFDIVVRMSSTPLTPETQFSVELDTSGN